MTRPSSALALALTITALASCAGPAGRAPTLVTASAPADQGTERPNVIVIFVDDLGWGDIASFGHPTTRTPNLDRMADEGVRLTQFYVASALCTPSRAGLLTGRHPLRSGTMARGAPGVLFPNSTEGLPPSEITLAEALSSVGYATAAVGKWHLGSQPGYLPTDQGFDTWLGIPYSNDMGRRPGVARLVPGLTRRDAIVAGVKIAPPDSFDVPLVHTHRDGSEGSVERPADQRTLTPRYTDEATRFVREQAGAGRPFFLYLAHTFPHVPLYASPAFDGRSLSGPYGDVVEELDWSVGEVLRAVAEEGIEQNTLVVFTSDNGPWLRYQEQGGLAGPLRGGKASGWEGGFRVPFIARWPGHVPAGRTVREVASTLDLLPTALNAAGLDPRAVLPTGRTLDGRSMLGLLTGQAETFETGFEDGAFPFYVNGELFAIRRGPWKAHFVTWDLYSTEPPVRHAPPLLYHLGRDPGERYDVAADHPEVVADLVALAARIDARIDRGRDVLSPRTAAAE